MLLDTETFPKVPFKEIVTSKRLTDFLGTGFLGLNGKEWWAVKKHFAGAFHFSAMGPLIPVFHERTKLMLDAMLPKKFADESAAAYTRFGENGFIDKTKWAYLSQGDLVDEYGLDIIGEVDMKPWVTRLSLDILGHTMFGKDLGALRSTGSSPTDADAPSPKCRRATGTDSPMMEAYDCFFDSIGDVRTAMLPNYDAWPCVSRHKSCLPRSLALLNKLIMDTIVSHEAELDRREALVQARGHGTVQGKRIRSTTTDDKTEEGGGEQDIADAARSVVESQRQLQEFGPTNLLHSMIHSIRSATKAGQPPPLSQEDLRANVLTFFIAGHDTTSSALSWAIFYLATRYPSQELLREEVVSREPWRDVTPEEAMAAKAAGTVPTRRAPTYDDVKPGAMPYMDAFINEVLRIRPPLGNFLTRKATRDVKVGGYWIRKGQMVSPSIFNVHHDPKIWKRPHLFEPSRCEMRGWCWQCVYSSGSRGTAPARRFLDDSEGRKRHPYAYLPFLLGKRKCIGANFSLLEQRIFLAELVARYLVVPPMHTAVTGPPAPHVAFHSPTHIDIRLKPRSRVLPPCSTADDASSVPVAAAASSSAAERQ